MTRFRKIFLGLVPHSQNNVCKSKAPQNNNNNNKSKLIRTSLASAYGITALITGTCIGLLGATLYGTNNVSAVGTSVQFQVINNNILTLTMDSIAELNIVPTSNGTFNKVSLPITVETNNSTGYQLTMLANNTSLYRTVPLASGDKPSISPIDDNNGVGYTEQEFSVTKDSDTSANNTLYNNTVNKWGYSVTKNSITTNYLPATLTTAKLGGNDSTTNGDTTIVNLASKMDNNTPSGTYTTTLVFTAIANITTSTCNPNSICYDKNGANNGTGGGSMSSQDVSGSDTPMLWASNYSYTNHGFAGWNTKPDGTGTSYGPHQTLTQEQKTTILEQNGGILYANWIPVERDANGYPLTMQEWADNNGCADLTPVQVTGIAPNLSVVVSDNSIIALKDERDSNTYAIGKFGDNCWMMENLRLNDSSTLSDTNTNNPNLPLIQTDGTITASHLSATSSTWCYWDSNNSTITGEGLNNWPDCVNRSKLNTANTASTIANMTGNGQNVYSYGNYYNWYSATSGWGKYDNYTVEVDNETINVNSATNNTDIPGSICPADWHLPNGGNATRNAGETKSDFWQLGLTIMNGTTPNIPNNNGYSYYDASTGATNAFRSYPYNFLFSGYWYDGRADYRGSFGLFWSSTANNASRAYDLLLYTSNVYPGTDNYHKHFGFAVRCTTGS